MVIATMSAGYGRLVSLVRGEDRGENIKKCLHLIKRDLGGLDDAKRVLVKPNLTALEPDFANTSVCAVKAVIDFINEYYPGREITVGEASGTAFYRGLSTDRVYEMHGYDSLTGEYDNVSLTNFDDETEFIEVPIESVVGEGVVHVTKRVEDFDYRVSVAVPKTHNFAIATYGVKNMAMGLVAPSEMSRVHGMKGGVEVDAPKTLLDRLPAGTVSKMRRILPNQVMNYLFARYPAYRKSVKMIHRNITSIAKVAWPHLVVLDGWVCMEGDGPIDGDPVPMKAAVASADPMKADAVAARLMGFEPQDIGYLHYLQQDGYGDTSLDGLVGDNIEDIKRTFRRHGTYNIQRQWRL
jgi:uncharacterized protein (DUF362 family)